MATEKTLLQATEAVELGMREFKSLYQGEPMSHVLLEGLELIDDEWLVTIGFDIGRTRRPSAATAIFSASALDEPVRELRTVVIGASDGSFRRLLPQ
ncbi:MAG: hypothetical protein AAF618_04300 [Pseudomonadota bacterium]